MTREGEGTAAGGSTNHLWGEYISCRYEIKFTGKGHKRERDDVPCYLRIRDGGRPPRHCS